MKRILSVLLVCLSFALFSQTIFNPAQIGQTGRNQCTSRGFWVKSDTFLVTANFWLPIGGGANKVLMSDANGFGTWQSITNTAWGLTGNSGTTSITNFIGTTDAVDFITKTNNSERVRITSAGDVAINNNTAKAKLQVKGANTDGYSFLLGDSVIDAGGKTFVANKSFFGLTVPSIRNGYVGDLSMIGLGNGTTYWNDTSIGVGSIVVAGVNDKASGANSQVYGGAANVASGSNSTIIGGLLNSASSSSSTIISSSASSTSDTSALIIASFNSNATGNNSTIISSSSTDVSGVVSGAFLSESSTVTGNVSAIIASSDCQVDADYSLIINSSDCHIDKDTNANSNTIIGSTLTGIDGNARLSTALGSYKTTLNGTHSVSLSAAYAESYAYHETLLGNSPLKDSTGNPTSWVENDILINVGNATDSTESQSCFIIIKGGQTIIADSIGEGDIPTVGGAMLRVKGSVRIDDGTQANDYVLTSDANGLASWLPKWVKATGAGNAPTINGTALTITTDTLTTAAQGITSIVITDSYVTSSSVLTVTMGLYGGTYGLNGQPLVVQAYPDNGFFTITVANQSSVSPLNGTLVIYALIAP